MTKNVSISEGYKKTELGAIPEEWEVVKLGDEKYFQIVSGGTPSRYNPDFWTNGSINWATPTDITKNKGYFLYSTKEKINENGLKNSSAKIIPKGSVLLTSRATIGAVAINNVDLATNQGFANFVLTGAVCNYYLLLTLEFNKQKLESLCGQSTFKEVSKKTLKDFKILMPPLPEQQKIASILSKVDEQIEQTEQIIEKTEILKKGLMQKLLTKGIGHTKFKKTEFGEIPEGWGVAKLQELTYFHKQGYYTKEKYVENGVKLLRITDIDNIGNVHYETMPSLNVSKKDYENYKLEPGDFAFARSGAIGRVGLVRNLEEVIFASYIIKFKFNQELIENEYFIRYFNGDIFHKELFKMIQGASNQNVNAENIKKCSVILPPLPEQQKIASILSKVDSQIQDNHNYLNKLQELKKGLMQDLLTGKVRVCV